LPFFMDVHKNLDEVTAEGVAKAHLADTAAQADHGVIYHRYFINEEAGTVFCIAEGPSAAACQAVHEVAHGNTAEEIIEVAPLAVEAFMGAPIVDGHGLVLGPDGRPDRAERTIVFTDIVESTALGQELGDEMGLQLVEAHDRMVLAALTDRSGRVVKRTGDGSMISFTDPEDAVGMGVDLQSRLSEARGATSDAIPLHVRVGINLGEPVAAHGDLFGTAVNLARRVCDAAGPDEILVTTSVAARVGEVTLIPLGQHHLKGFGSPVDLYRVGP
jgi:class 3 adenylate cyclase